MSNEERILSMLEAIQAEQQKTNERLGNLEDGQARLEDGQAKLETDMSILKDDVSILKEDVSILKEDVSILKEDVFILKEDVSILQEEMSTLKEDVIFVRNTVTRMEQVHGQKLGALFDGYMQLTQRADRTDEHVATQDKDILKRVFPNTMAK